VNNSPKEKRIEKVIRGFIFIFLNLSLVRENRKYRKVTNIIKLSILIIFIFGFPLSHIQGLTLAVIMCFGK